MSSRYLDALILYNSATSNYGNLTVSGRKKTPLEILTGVSSKDSECLDKYENKISEIDLKKYNIEREKREDGSSKIKEKTGEGFWNKCKRWLGNAGATLKNIGKSLIGIDQNGNWNPWDLAKNAALIGACFIPYVGPVVAYGLCAYGLYKAVPGVIEGVKDLKHAKTDEEIDAAQQKILGNGITSALSLFGVRGVGKSFRVNPATAPKASIAKVRTSAAGKLVEGSSNFVRDITVNAAKGVLHETGRGVQAVRSLSSLNKKFVSRVNKAQKPITEQLESLKSKIDAETNPNYKALYEEQYDLMAMKQQEINSVENINQTQLAELRTQNAVTKAENRLSSFKESADGQISFKRSGKTYTINKKDPIYKQFKEAINKSNKKYAEQLADMITNREQIMIKCAAKPDKYAAELDKYIQKSLKDKYTNPEALESGIQSLESKLADTRTKIANYEAKLKNTGKKRAIDRLSRELELQQKVETSLEQELAICKAIKFKKWYRPSTWGKNKYQIATKGGGSLGFGPVVRNRLLSLRTAGSMMALAQANPIYSDAWGYSTELSPEQTEKLIDVMTRYSEAFKFARQKLVEAQDNETVEQYTQAFDVLNEQFEQEYKSIINGEEPEQKTQDDEGEKAGDTASQNTSNQEQQEETKAQNPSESEQEAAA